MDLLRRGHPMFACWLLMLRLGAVGALPEGGYLYRATLFQAAPGRLLEVVDLVKSGWPGMDGGGDEAPLVMRHSQGDRWDLLLLFPMENFAAFYSPNRVERRQRARETAHAQLERLAEATAWQEDVFVFGPPLARIREIGKAGFFHVEMFEALPGKARELYRQRLMKNAYSAALDLPENLIFVRDCGAPWD